MSGQLPALPERPQSQVIQSAIPRYDDNEQGPTNSLFGVLGRRKLVILLVTAVIAIPGILVITRLSPYFDAQALLAINTRKASFRDLQATVEVTNADAIAIATQVGIIRSPEMALRVVDRLHLDQAHEFTKVMDEPPPPWAALVSQAAAWLGAPIAPAAKPTAEDRRQLTGRLLANDVTVINDGRSYLITIQVRTGDPSLSAGIANTYADLYLDFNRDLKIAAIRRANSLLDVQIAPMQQRLRTADEAVEAYRESNGLITNSGSGTDTQAGRGMTVAEDQLGQINAQYIKASGELATKQAKLAQIREAVAAGRLESLPAVVDSPLINTLRAQQTELSTKVASLSQTALPNNPTLQSALAASADVQRRINSEVSKIAASVSSEVAAAQGQVDSLRATLAHLQGQVAGESRANVTLRQLQSEASAARTVYQDYLGRFEQTSSEGALQEPEADLISAAVIPAERAGPRRGQLSAIVVVGALFIACLFALVLDRMRRGIRTMEQLEAETGLFGLGMVPLLSGSLFKHFELGRSSIYTGAIGMVSSVLRFGGDKFRARVVLVTSAAPSEGKTTFAVSLAANVGREGGKALLIDCDLIRPAVAKALRMNKGSKDAAAAATDGMLRQSVLPGLDVMILPGNKTGLHLETDVLRRAIADAREHYDLIVIDAPPVLALADAPVLSLQTDGVIMVVHWRHTPIAAVTSALRLLQAYGVRILGGVITRVKLQELGADEGGHSYLYRSYTSAKYFK